MTNTTAANGKQAAYFGVPAEGDYGYAQAIKIGNTIHVSGQLTQDNKGTLIALAALDETGNRPMKSFSLGRAMAVTPSGTPPSSLCAKSLARGKVSDADLKTVREAGYTDANVMEIVALVAMYFEG